MLGHMAARKTGRIFVGVGGWNFPPWRGRFYPKGLPQKQELHYASRHLTSIEVNSTFYGTQKAASFQRWYDETPEGFVFSVKAPMYATHRRVLAEADESVDRFFGSGVLKLCEKLGPINWQFGPTKRFVADDLETFIDLLPRKLEGRAIRHAFEVRHESFDCDEFVALARRHRIAIVRAGDSKFPDIDEATADFSYLRIMGTKASQAKGYAAAALTRWAKAAQKLAASKPARDVYLYVISGAKERNPAAAQALIEKIA
jgi:uncharacterized protein YecE (DUF72 family)